MSNNIVINEWDNKNKHVDESIASGQFLSSARVIIYAASDVGKSGEESYSDFKKIGLIQGYQWGENKQVDMIFELGSEIPYLIPGRTSGQISISRILLNGHDLINVLHGSNASDPSKWIKSLKDIDKPISLMFAAFGNKNSNDTAQAVYSRVFKDCYITSRNENIAAGQTVTAEGVTIMYTDIISLENTFVK